VIHISQGGGRGSVERISTYVLGRCWDWLVLVLVVKCDVYKVINLSALTFHVSTLTYSLRITV
jgi:hypothetical protein